MRLIDAEQKLLALKEPIIQTRDASACLQISKSQASKILDNLVKSNRFVRLMRGKWATSHQIDPLILPENLTAPFPSYISLQTALFYHGIISQIPHTIYAVSLARTKQFKTSFGNISIHHLHPDFFFGYENIGLIKMATPEKALIDILYLSPGKSNLFKKLPELELSHQFNLKKAYTIIKKIPSHRTRSLVKVRLDELIKGNI